MTVWPCARWSGGDAYGVLSAEASDGAEPLGDFYSPDLAAHRQALGEAAAARGQPLEEVVAALPRGGICLHDWRTFHGSGPNVSARGLARRSFAVHCRTDLATRVPGSHDYYVSRPPRDSDPQELLLGPKKYLLL
jgi:hypothetical protein